MRWLKVPKWVSRFDYPFLDYGSITDQVFEGINAGLRGLVSDAPEVSVVISAYNEEVDILKTVGSLSAQETGFPLEIVVINNNSNDHTQETLDRLQVRTAFQPIQGWGPGRQMGMEMAKGKYILLADADCIYPKGWVETMTRALKSPGVVCVYGRYAFISEKGFPRWKLSLLETLKDLITEVRHVKRPYLNTYGMSMGFIREFGMKEGFYMNKTHGEDGRMAYDLMKYGRIKQVRSDRNRVWTGVRTLRKSGNFSQVMMLRIKKEIRRFGEHFTGDLKKLHPKE